MLSGTFAGRWSIRRDGGLTGGTIHVAGLSQTMTYVLVWQERLDGTTHVTRLLPTSPRFTAEAATRRPEGARTNTAQGVEQILTGVDRLPGHGRFLMGRHDVSVAERPRSVGKVNQTRVWVGRPASTVCSAWLIEAWVPVKKR